MASDDQGLVPFAQHGDGIGADEARRGATHGREQIAVGLQRLLDQMGDDFGGVGIRAEGIAGGQQFLLQLGVVLDDAVMHHRETAGNVRMGIAFRRARRASPSACGRCRDGAWPSA